MTDSELLKEVTRDMRATVCTEVPYPNETKHWIETHDTQTGRITWTRCDLFEKWARLQLVVRGIC